MTFHQRRRNSGVCRQLKNHGCICFGWEWGFSCECLAQGDDSELQQLYWNAEKCECSPFYRVSYKKHFWNVASP
jgi:hypothetical protein